VSASQPDPFAGVVTAADVYAKVVVVGEAVRVVDTKVELAAGALGEMRTHIVDHESRLRVVEGDRWPYGKLTAVLALAGVLIAVLALLMKV
jgi:hypothetical protein